MTNYVVQFLDGSKEVVTIDDEAQSDDHFAEMIALASSRPDDVDDWWLARPSDGSPGTNKTLANIPVGAEIIYQSSSLRLTRFDHADTGMTYIVEWDTGEVVIENKTEILERAFT